MEDLARNRLVVILAALNLIFFFGTLSSCSNARKQKSLKDKEMFSRIDVEEKMSKVSQDKTYFEDKLKIKDKELEDEKTAHQSAKKILAQEQLLNQSLREELAKVIKLKEAAEDELRKALGKDKASKR
jgi:hypothetical protein